MASSVMQTDRKVLELGIQVLQQSRGMNSRLADEAVQAIKRALDGAPVRRLKG